MTNENARFNLFELGREYLLSFLKEFEVYGIYADPGIELRKGIGLFCYYNFDDRNIYLSVPNLDDPGGKLHLLLLRSLLHAENNEEVLQFFRLFLPVLIAHELAHHLRHRYGLFSPDLWYEEQVANQLAMALTKHRFSPEEKEYVRRFLRRASEGLSEKMEAPHVGVDSYDSILHSLNTSGQISDAIVEDIKLVQKLFAIDMMEILKDSGQLSEALVERLEHRGNVINDINKQYISDYVKYTFYQLEWLHLALMSREMHYIDEFAKLHLHRAVSLLPVINDDSDPTDESIKACFKAYQDTAPYSKAASQYFYKRYRSLLWAKLQAIELPPHLGSDNLKEQEALFLETSHPTESDSLIYLAHLAPSRVRDLFPHLIVKDTDIHLPVVSHLPTETDKRLWSFCVLHTEDEAAANTLARLTLLAQADIFQPLPAEVLLQFAHDLYHVKLAPGETVIWEGQRHCDVFILNEGKLEALVLQNGQLRCVETIHAGEIFGEMSFFTREPRSATVRAAEASECFVFKDFELKYLAFKHPSILMQMASAIAKRLTRKIASGSMRNAGVT
jgi:hypothetical protein